MPLPESGTDLEWPPVEWKHVYSRYKEHAAWYSGNPNELASVYYAMGSRPQGFWRTNFDRFWARTPAPQTRLMLHEPVAAALCTVSSDLLFAEPPEFVMPDGADDSGKIQERLDELIREESVVRTLSELAETVAALGGGFLRVIWDKINGPDHPMLNPVDADLAVPDFRYGRLSGVTFWNVVQGTDYSGGAGLVSDDKAIWRHLERHEPGYILTGLYEGTRTHLGVSRPLGSLGLMLPEAIVETKIDDLTAVYIPNVRPNRLFRGTALGRSDFDGVEAEMDALDEAATSLMRDLRLARARLIVPQDMLESQGKGKGAKFDLDQEVWEGAPSGVPSFGNDKLITPSQFLIRSQDHLAVIKAKIEMIIIAAGYSSTSFGFDEPRRVPATATEIVNRERQSFLTRSKKISYWTPAIEDILEAFLEIDAVHFNQSHGVARPRVDFAASIRDDAQQTATIVHILRAAESASAEVRVRLVWPKWSDKEVAAEVEKILAEGAAPVKPPDMNPIPTSPNGQPADQPQDGQRIGNFAADLAGE
jgi:hypothetical protein